MQKHFSCHTLLILLMLLTPFSICPCFATDFIVHRGDMINAPENTMAAFQEAKRNGAAGCEIDVRITRDGVLVLSHDASLKRATGKDVRINDLTLAECRKFDVGSWRSSKYRDEKIPTLDEVLAFMQREKMYPLFDVKDTAAEKDIIALVQKYGLSDKTLFIAYSTEQSRRLKELDPKVTPMIQTFKKKNEMEDIFFERVVQMLKEGKTNGVFTGYVNKALLAKFHDRSIRVLVGSTTTQEKTDAVRNIGYDYIITDNPQFIQEIKEK